MNPEAFDSLERSVGKLLKDLPPAPAPSALEARVLREIAGQAARPWWRRPFAAWPVPARMAFVFLSAAAAGLCLLPVVMQPALPAVAAGFVERAGVAVVELRELASAVGVAATASGGWIRPIWIYTAAAFLFLSYAGLFRLGTVAWRTIRPRA
jgi:hypothetical protein